MACGPVRPTPAPEPSDEVWLGTFRAPVTGEAVMFVLAEASGTSWAQKGKEAAVLTVTMDGQYVGDLVLFMGAESHAYGFLLGPVEAGDHPISLRLAGEKGVKAPVRVSSVTWSVYDPDHPLYPVISHSPLLYGRPVMNRSDTPLLGYFEEARKGDQTVISYTIIFSNEDGGTKAPGLMARWGRLTDIEWVYSVALDAQGQEVEETIQGRDHKTQVFAGQRRGRHPLLRVATENNMVSDSGTSSLLFAPFVAWPLPAESPREAMMDRNPWIYRIMAEEWSREGVEVPGRAVTVAVSDPRNYLYVTYKARFLLPSSGDQCGLRLAAAVLDSQNGRWYTSDHGDADLRVALDGWRRIAIELPPGTGADRLTALRFQVYGSRNGPSCQLVLEAAGPVFLLDEKYLPGPSLWTWQGQAALDADEGTADPDHFVLSRS